MCVAKSHAAKNHAPTGHHQSGRVHCFSDEADSPQTGVASPIACDEDLC